MRDLEQLFRIVRLSERGILALRGMPRLTKAVLDAKGESANPESHARLDVVRQEAALAETEAQRNFPVLHGFAVVALWSWLEYFVSGLMSLWLVHRRDAWASPSLHKLRIKIGEYQTLQTRDKADYIIRSLEQDSASPLKRGAGRFEGLLESFELGGTVPEDCGRLLFELQQVRNAIAHHNSRADRQLLSACPWLKLPQGAPLRIDGQMLRSYSDAAAQYILTILYRVGDRYKVDLRKASEE